MHVTKGFFFRDLGEGRLCPSIASFNLDQSLHIRIAYVRRIRNPSFF